MNIRSLTKTLNVDQTGCEMHRLIEKLYPICRSITGNGVRKSLNIIRELIPVEVHEVPSGTHVFDWTVPREWNIADAYIRNSKGEKIVDENNMLFNEASSAMEEARGKHRAELKAQLEEINKDLKTAASRKELLREKLLSDKWTRATEPCVECGACRELMS